MAVDINNLLDSALANAQALQAKVAQNSELQLQVTDLQNKLTEVQTQINNGSLNADQEKKLQDLSDLLSQLSG